MKTTEKTNSHPQAIKHLHLKLKIPSISPIATHPSKSVRPQRSMMRVQSLRPNKLIAVTRTKKPSI